LSVVELSTPLDEGAVRALHVGDVVTVTGVVVTARDRAHAYLAGADVRGELPFELAGGVIYHCGPIGQKTAAGLRVISAGPTTSARMNPYERLVVERYGVRAIIGKGGMADELLETFSRVGCVYLSAYGGCGALYARHIGTVVDVFKQEEFGAPEALWLLEVQGFPAIVTMDAHGGSLHREIRQRSRQAAADLGLP